MKAKEYLNQIGIVRTQDLKVIDDRVVDIMTDDIYMEFDLVELMEDYAEKKAIEFETWVGKNMDQLISDFMNLDFDDKTSFADFAYQKFKDESR